MRDKTKLCHIGRSSHQNYGVVNPPIYRGSTILFSSIEDQEYREANPFTEIFYPRYGLPTTKAVEETIADLEGGSRSTLTSSGLTAIAMALMAVTAAGDHVLISDSVYGPTRRFAATVLTRYGIQVAFYDPRIGSGIDALIQSNTRAVFLESPGSLTFEVQDVPAIVAAVRKKETTRPISVIIDNTWATPLFFKPLAHGVNIVLHSATKYLGGHSDMMFGVISGDQEYGLMVKESAVDFGITVSPDEAYACLRGLRTLEVRLQAHYRNTLLLADYLAQRPEVDAVLYPPRSDHPDHAIWARDYSGASGLFAIFLKPCPKEAVAVLLNSLSLFGIGYSWGGYESLITPVYPHKIRSAVPWDDPRPLIRIHVGLEDIADLIDDFEQGFQKFHQRL